MQPPLKSTQALHQLGMTRLCALSLVGFYSFFIMVQQWLPYDQPLLHLPKLYLVVLVFVIGTYAIRCTFSKQRILSHRRQYVVGGIMIMMTSVIFFSFLESFAYGKSLISIIHPYAIDPFLQRADIWLHGNVAPGIWLVKSLPDWAMKLMADSYLLSWILVYAIYMIWQISSAPNAGRTLFLSSFVMLWFYGGLVIATLFASVGPIYYSEFYSDAYSAMNAAFVESLNSGTAALPHGLSGDIRGMLLDFYRNDRLVDSNAISAMPSVHVGTAMLIALHSYFYTRWIRWLTIPFALFIFVASIALGWHYAIDGYAACAILFIIWRVNQRELARTMVA